MNRFFPGASAALLAAGVVLFLALGAVVLFGAPLIVVGLLLTGWGLVCVGLIGRNMRHAQTKVSEPEFLWALYRVRHRHATREEFSFYWKTQREFFSRYGWFMYAPGLIVWFAFCIWIIAQAL